VRYDNLLMDADGTIFDFDRSEAEAVAATLDGFSLPHDEMWVNTYHKINDLLWKALERGETDKPTLRTARFQQLLDHFGASGDAAAIADAYTEELSKRSYLMPDAEEVCRKLSEKYDIYVITNGTISVQVRRFAASPVKEYIKGYFISGEIGFEKPDTRYFDHVKAHIPNFSDERALVIGDSLTSDIRGAQAAGLDACYFGKELPPSVKVKYHIRKLKELEDILL